MDVIKFGFVYSAPRTDKPCSLSLILIRGCATEKVGNEDGNGAPCCGRDACVRGAEREATPGGRGPDAEAARRGKEEEVSWADGCPAFPLLASDKVSIGGDKQIPLAKHISLAALLPLSLADGVCLSGRFPNFSFSLSSSLAHFLCLQK